jgi:hypothetical protein
MKYLFKLLQKYLYKNFKDLKISFKKLKIMILN